MTDRITLTGLECHGRHGVFDFERRDGQTFVIDVVLGLDTRRAAETDDLADTADYGSLADDIVADVGGDPVDLIETLAARLAALCLDRPGVDWVEVTVHKPQAPIMATFADVAVTIRREARDA